MCFAIFCVWKSYQRICFQFAVKNKIPYSKNNSVAASGIWESTLSKKKLISSSSSQEKAEKKAAKKLQKS